MPNIHVYLPEKLNKEIEKQVKLKRRSKSDLIHLSLIKSFLGDEELKRELGEEPEEEEKGVN